MLARVDPGKQSDWMPKNGPAGMGGPGLTIGYAVTGKKVSWIRLGGVVPR